jgi:peptidoglycan/xylan/chitin deacetylase (PgdA/CDA1 family)
MRVLCYHSISDLSGSTVLHAYGVPPDQFQQQLRQLKESGLRFIDSDEFLSFLHGNSDKFEDSILLTFDDCYQDLLNNALPILEAEQIPAVAFAVTARLGKSNEWDRSIDATSLPLLDKNGLEWLSKKRVKIGSHSRTHAKLTKLSAEELTNEITGSLNDLETSGFDRPSLFAYPYGIHNQIVRKAVQDAGIFAAFTVNPNPVSQGQDPFQIPRIEILRDDVGSKFLAKVLLRGYN